jgi:iron complex outermembrane receptor protein
LGLRYNRLNRASITTSGTSPTHDERNIATPWIGLSQKINDSTTAYASYGEGVESAVVPNKPLDYANAGQPLPTLRSKQKEIGIKKQTTQYNWQVTWFDIQRPATSDSYDTVNSISTRQIDGEARHQGLELSGVTTAISQWNLGAGYTKIDAQRQNSTVDSSLNGQRPINVPAYILRASAEYKFSSIPGLRSGLRLSREGDRNVTEHGEIKLPAWTTLGATTHYDTKVNNVASTWTLAIENLADKQYWRESPIQYGHYYLYPGAPRTVRATVQFRL